MNVRFGRRAGALVGAAVAVPLVAASIAYGCTALATLSLNNTQADAGGSVSGSGRAFSNATRGSASPEPVIVHFNTRTGPVLWSGRPDAGGNVAFNFNVPGDVQAGSYAIIATQNTADGQPVPGTPARATLTVSGPRATANATPVAATDRSTGSPAAQAAVQPAPGRQAAAAAPGAVAVAPAPAAVNAPAGSAASSPAGAPAVAGPAAAPATATAADNARVVAPAASAPAPAAGQRSTMVGARPDSSAALPLALVAAGLVLTLTTTGMVVARRRKDAALSWTRR